MSWWKNLRAGASVMREHQQAALEAAPRWARVVRVGHGASGMVSVEAEIHYGQTPPHSSRASCRYRAGCS